MRRVAFVLALSVCTPVRSAHAQVSAGNAALAEKLFNDARQLMARKAYADACPKLAESQRLDPGVGTLLNLGDCYEKSGKIASAWATYHDAESAAARDGQKKRASFAAGRARALEPSLSYLVIEPPAGGGASVTCDAKELGASSLGSPLPFDAGVHHLEATAAGRKPWSKDVEVPLKGTVHVGIELEAAPPPPVVTAPTPPILPSVAPPPPAGSGRLPRTFGVVAGGVGLVGLGVGSYFGLRAKRTNDDADRHCTPTTCSQAGRDLTNDARGQATASTVFFVVGAVALVSGIVLYLAAPRSRAAPRLGLAF